LTVDPGLAQFDSPLALQYYADVSARVSAVPGVNGVTWAVNTALSSDRDRESATLSGYTPSPNELVMLERNAVGPRYHEVFGIPLVAGRGFDERDVDGSPLVAIINETAAKRYFAGRSAIGAYVTMGNRSMQVVGVSRDTKNHELSEAPSPYVYMPLLQLSGNGVGAPTLVVRVQADGFRSTRSIVDAARSANTAVPVFDVATMTQRLRSVLAPQLVGAGLLGAFGVLALIVAAIGIYGVVAYAVSQRTREIGIRMALGARSASVLGLVVRGNVAFVAVGIPIGIALGLMLARAMARFLYGIRPTDPLTVAVTSFTILVVGALAAFVPARRAVRIDPLIALRSDD
jgi:predicted permease